MGPCHDVLWAPVMGGPADAPLFCHASIQRAYGSGLKSCVNVYPYHHGMRTDSDAKRQEHH
jgi:hypothetical protein